MEKNRQAMNPQSFDRTQREDYWEDVTSGEAGVVTPVSFAPLLRGDSASGSATITLDLAEMPRPLINGVRARVQAWFVPKSAFPQFSGYDEYYHSYQGLNIKQIGAADRTPPPFFNTVTVDTDLMESEFVRVLGLHFKADQVINTDIFDAFNVVHNFRTQAHSSKLPLRSYCQEDIDEALTLPAAFWAKNNFTHVVADYDRALVKGALDLDVVAGQMPVQGLFFTGGNLPSQSVARTSDGGGASTQTPRNIVLDGQPDTDPFPLVFTEMAGETIETTLADLSKAKLRQSFAKLRAQYAGNNANGFVNDDAILAELMQGFAVPEEQFKRPWLLDSQDVTFGMVERHASDAGNLDQSLSQGVASATVNINVPTQKTGGYIIVQVEVMPDRVYEAQSDEFFYITSPDQLPDAQRDMLREEPVDTVLNRRLDARHTVPNGLYGFEPMNSVWKRRCTRLGGVFFQATAGSPWTEQRAGVWQPNIVDPAYTDDHFKCPYPFPKTPFSDLTKPAWEGVVRHNIQIAGITQFAEELIEDNGEFDAIE